MDIVVPDKMQGDPGEKEIMNMGKGDPGEAENRVSSFASSKTLSLIDRDPPALQPYSTTVTLIYSSSLSRSYLL
jgi:hypothetical protein